MRTDAALTTREVAELSGAPKRVVEKAIEEHIVPVRSRRSLGATRRMLPPHAVGYAAVISRLELRLSPTHKKRLARQLAHLASADLRSARIELAPAVELDVGRLAGEAMDRAERYRAARDTWIVSDPAIMGGTPVIRSTRVTVYSVLGRVAHGDSVSDIAQDNPDLPLEAIDAAITYARTHPSMGRPSGRPWAQTA